MPAFVATSALLFSLWDFYFGPFAQGFRPFDLLAAGVLFVGLAGQLALRPRLGQTFRPAGVVEGLLLVLLVLLAVVAGALADPGTNLKPALGVGIGAALFLIFRFFRLDAAAVERLLAVLIAIHATALFVQAGAYLATGEVLNYHAFIGDAPRVLGRLFRPCGLFLEPAHYAVFMIMLLAVKLRLSGFDRWTVLGCVSVFFTLSVYGILATVALIAIHAWRRPAFWIAAALAGGVLASYGPQVRDVGAAFFLLDRLGDVREDESAIQRYSGLSGIADDIGTSWSLVGGRGVSNDYERYGRSGIAFLLNAWGLLGATLFLGLVFALAPPGHRWPTVLVLGLAMAAAPRWTIWLWWVWLGLILNPLSGARPRAAEPQAQPA
jgi:hypothetical protein